MGLKQQQDLLARLYTDEPARKRFREGPTAVAKEFGLSVDESNDLSEITSAEIDWFADSLYWKRLREVKKVLPVSTRMVGEKMAPLFREFSGGFNPTSVKKHLDDALGFAYWLLKRNQVDGAAADVVKFESTRLRHHATERRLSICYLAHDVRPLFSIGPPGREAELPPRKSVAIWIMSGRRDRFIFL